MTPPSDSSVLLMAFSSHLARFSAFGLQWYFCFLSFLSEFFCKRDFWITTSSVAKKGVGGYLVGSYCSVLGDLWPRPQGALTP